MGLIETLLKLKNLGKRDQEEYFKSLGYSPQEIRDYIWFINYSRQTGKAPAKRKKDNRYS